MGFNALFGALGWHLDWVTMQIILPVGISFYTFQALSYSIDVYQRTFLVISLVLFSKFSLVLVCTAVLSVSLCSLMKGLSSETEKQGAFYSRTLAVMLGACHLLE